ncbi:MAG: hypothetical protein ABIQ11_06660 [Saprospiraceae bacterium]
MDDNTYLLLDTIRFDAFINALGDKIIGNYIGTCYLVNTDFINGQLVYHYDTLYNQELKIQEFYPYSNGVRMVIMGDCILHQMFYLRIWEFQQDSFQTYTGLGPHSTNITVYYNNEELKTRQ